MEMNDMYQYLTPIDRSELEHILPQSFVVYRSLDNQKFLCTDYARLTDFLATSLFHSNLNRDLLCDLTFCPTHTLIFDIDIKYTTFQDDPDTTALLLRYFDLVFLNVIEKHLALCLPTLTLLLSLRRDGSGGLHVHCPGIEICHDDYVHLCGLMRDACRFQEDDVVIELDCPSSMCLVACDKPYKSSKSCSDGDRPGLYVPVRLIRVRFEPYFDERDEVWKSRKVDFLTLHNPCDSVVEPSSEPRSLNESLFERIEHSVARDRWIELASFMMPMQCPHEKGSTLLTFSTEAFSCHHQNCVAEFTSFANRHYYLHKTRLEKKIVTKMDEESESYCYRLLKHHSESMEDFQSLDNRVLKTWYKRFCNRDQSKKRVGHFQFIDRYLRKKCIHLRNEESPLLTILTNSDARYFLPTFYALCNELEKKRLTPTDVISNLEKIIFEFEDPDTSYPIIKEILSRFKPGVPLPEASRHLTLDTILYCAFKAIPRKTNEGHFLKHIGLGWEFIFELIDTVSEMQTYLRWVQKMYYPIVKGFDPFSKKETFYAWEPIFDQWSKMGGEDERDYFIKNVLISVFSEMKHFEGFKKMSKSLCSTLNEDFNWIDVMVHDIIVELSKTKAIRGNPLPNDLVGCDSSEFREKMYGCNVPQYYFLMHP